MSKGRWPFKRQERLALDTPIFIYHLEANAKYLKACGRLLRLIETGQNQGVTTIISLAEILVRPFSLERASEAEDYKIALTNFPNLIILELDLKTAIMAAGLKAKYNLKLPDAFQVSGALKGQADYFITNDKKLKKIEEIKVLLLDEL